MDNYTLIKVYGFPKAPQHLPKFVFSRGAFLEFMWQMMWMEKCIMEKKKKGTLFPHVNVCACLSIGFYTLQELKNYLKSRVERICDLEGHINFVK